MMVNHSHWHGVLFDVVRVSCVCLGAASVCEEHEHRDLADRGEKLRVLSNETLAPQWPSHDVADP